MAEARIIKQQLAVRRVIDALRRSTPLRRFITRQSEQNLLRQAIVQPAQTRAFLKNLLRMEALAVPIDKFVVPRNLAKPQNREVFSRLSEMGFLFRLIDDGRLDLRGAGLKQKMPQVDLTPTAACKQFTLEDYQAVLKETRQSLTADEELGNLFLFKAILKARIDLYQAGEARSAARRCGEKLEITPELRRVKDFLDFLTRTFPFGRTVWRAKAQDDLRIASLLLKKCNNPAADTKLAGLSRSLERSLTSQMRERLRQTARSRGWKVKYLGRGVWRLATTGYCKTETGLMRKVGRVQHVRTPELLSMLQHVIDSISAEIEQNKNYLAELKDIQARLPDVWDRLFEIYLKFTEYEAMKKDKAGVEMAGALQLLPIGSHQAVRLAGDLLGLAQGDIGLRQNELAAQKSRFACLKPAVEEKLGRELSAFAQQIAVALTSPAIRSDPKQFQKIEDRLGGYLGTFLKGELREGWLRRVKSRVYGTKLAMPGLKDLARQKSHFLERTVGLRDVYAGRRREILRDRRSLPEKRQELAELQEEIFDLVRKNFLAINEINAQLTDGLRKAAATLLSVYSIHANRHGGTVSRQAHQTKYAAILDALALFSGDQVEVLSNSGKVVLGRVARRDARAMGFQNLREVSENI